MPCCYHYNMNNHTTRRTSLELKITGRNCTITRNDHIERSLDEGGNLMEFHQGSNVTSEPSISMPTQCSSSLRIDRYDARLLLDEISLGQVLASNHHHNINIDDGILSSEYVSQPLQEEGNKEEVAARNFERYGMLAEFHPAFLKSEGGGAEEALHDRKPSLGSGDVSIAATQAKQNFPDDKEKPFELSEDQLRRFPSGITLVSR